MEGPLAGSSPSSESTLVCPALTPTPNDKLEANSGETLCNRRRRAKSVREEISNVDSEIAALETALDELRSRRQALHEYVQSLAHWQPLIAILPQEVLSRIFVFCLPTKHNVLLSRDQPPLVMGRVSKLWREVSLSTPQLWTSVHVVVKQALDNNPGPIQIVQHHDAVQHHSRSLDAWLHRSGNLPLSISFVAPPGADQLSASLLLTSIMNFCSRWRDIAISITRSSTHILDTLARVQTPLLRTLFINFKPTAVQMRRHGWKALDIGHLSMLRDAPRLSNLTLCGCKWQSATIRYLGCMTRLTIDATLWMSCSATDALVVLSNCPNLESFALKCTHLLKHDIIIPPVVLPQLTRLRVQCLERSRLPQLFDALVVPRLEHLELTARSYDMESTVPALPILHMLSASMCPLKTLILKTTLTVACRLSDCLALVPTLLQLDIESPTSHGDFAASSFATPALPDILDPNDLLTSLTLSPGPGASAVLCPRLETLKIQTFRAHSPASLRMIRSRCRAVPVPDGAAVLKRVHLRFGKEVAPSKHIMDEIEGMNREGADITVAYDSMQQAAARESLPSSWGIELVNDSLDLNED